MVKWPNIMSEWKEERPKHFWTHWFHDVFCEDEMWWNIEAKSPKCLCRTCKVWWRKNKNDDGFEEARLNVAEECLKRGKPIIGTMHEDGSFEVKEQK